MHRILDIMYKDVIELMLIKGGYLVKTTKMKYGSGEVNIQIDENNFFGYVQSQDMMEEKSEASIVLEALDNPIGSQRLRKLVRPGETVCIIISDITRAWQKPHLYLPYIIKELNESGTKDEDITFICATGSHRGQSEEEHKILLGEKLAKRFLIVDHDCRDNESLMNIGTTSFGTPVTINKIALKCDHIVLTGAIVFHDLVGWGGGKKSILPGISAYESIMANHKLSLNPNLGEGTNYLVRCGNVVNNPVHLDMLEAAAFVKPTFLLNVIIDEAGNIVKAVAGDYVKAHEAGQKMVDEADSFYIKEQADIVLVSAGGYPKDIDFYQASKALINAKEAVKKDGVIILLAKCSEGFGGKEVQQMLEEFSDNYSREKSLRENFSIAKYTGYLIAEIAETYNVVLVSSLNSKLLGNANIKAAVDVNEALNLAIQQKGIDAKIYIMPNGANILPRLI
jgi:nickel-dependent lactate racemase